MRMFTSLFLLFGLCFMVPAAESRESEVFLFEGVEALAGGRFDGTTLKADGIIRPGLQVDAWSYDEAKGFASMAVVSAKKIYVGTASKGRILLFDGEKYSEVFKSDAEKDQRVTALLHHADQLWAAFAPSGRLVRIDGEGKAHDIADVKATYVWSMTPDAKGGLRVATGTPGQLLHILGDGTIKERVLIDAEHVTDLKWQGSRLIIASAMPGRVLSRTGTDAPRVLFDLGQGAEIHRVHVANDGIFVAVNGGKTGGGVVPAPANKEKPRKPTASGGSQKPSQGAGAFGRLDVETPQTKPPKGASLWHLEESGGFRLVAALGKQAILDMVGSNEGVLLALSKDGRVVEATASGDISIVLDAKEAHIAGLNPAGWLITGGGASVQRFGPDARRARYVSKVRDAGAMVQVGYVDWHGEKARIEVRTGSTYDISDANWTAFAKVPELGGVPRVKAGRFIQVRATLGGADTHLRAVRVSYQAPNVAPSLHRVHVVDRKVKSTASKAALQKKRTRKIRKASKIMSSSKAKFYTGVKRIGFDVQDRNGDYLVFHVSVRRIGDRVWVPLTPEGGTPLLFVDWRVADWPEGDYEIKVLATDAQDNPPGEGLQAELLGGPIRVDNTPPLVSDVALRGGKIRFRVKDEGSKIRQVRIAVGNGPWQSVGANDGMIDSGDEFFAIELSQLGVRSSTVLRIQAQDTFGHLGRAGIEVRR
jgi:hypothetical protein